MQQPNAREERIQTCYKLLVTCTQTCTNPGCKKEYSVCQRADHMQGQDQGAAAAVPSSTTGVARERPGALTAVLAICPYCGHVTGIPVVYSGHEEQGSGRKTEKGRPIREATTEP